jgi:hypothetical protein
MANRVALEEKNVALNATMMVEIKQQMERELMMREHVITFVTRVMNCFAEDRSGTRFAPCTIPAFLTISAY